MTMKSRPTLTWIQVLFSPAEGIFGSVDQSGLFCGLAVVFRALNQSLGSDGLRNGASL